MTPVRRRPPRDAELEAELAFHRAETVEGLVARGWTEQDARAEADRRFGDGPRYQRGLARIARATRRQRRTRAMGDAMRMYLRDAWRGLRRTPGAACAIVLMLALGIGANATMFAVIDRLLLSPPDHLVDADRLRLVYAYRPSPSMRGYPRNLTYPDIQDLQHLPAFESLSAYTGPQRWTLGTGTDARKVRVQLADASCFPALGVRPARGRFYTAAEDEPGAPLTAVISEDFWARELGRDPGIIGRVLALNKGQYEVVGIAPAGFTGVEVRAVDVWVPLRAAMVVESGRRALETRTWWWAAAFVRLRPGVTDDAAAAQLTTRHLAARRAHEARGAEEPYLALGRPHFYVGSVIPARGPNPMRSASISLWVAGVSAIVLLIACANVANLLLTRGIQARRELAVRVALGADRTRLMLQVIVETALLAAAGALAALVVARWSGTLVRALLPDIAFGRAGLGTRMLLFNAAAAVATVLLAGILPALQAGRTSAAEALRTASRGYSASRSRLRGALMIAQATLSVVLLVGAGLFIRSLWMARGTDLGFDRDHVVVASIEEHGGSTLRRRAELYHEALPRVASLPGVRSAALAGHTIALDGYSGPGGVRVAGKPIIDDLPGGGPFLYSGTDAFFESMGVPITRGRTLTEADAAEGAEPVGMVNETFVRTIWPDKDPLTQCFQVAANYEARLKRPEPCRRVVGVFEDFARMSIEDQDAPSVAIPMSRERTPNGIVARVSGDPDAFVALIRQTIVGVSPDVRFVQVETMAARFDRQLAPWRLGATMFAVFGMLALLVAAVGLYSLLAFGVAQRRREIGIRAALGAARGDLVRLILTQAARFIVAGLALGLAIALAAGQFLDRLLFGVTPTDPVVYAIVILTVAVSGTLAGLIPAWRATSVSPTTAIGAD